MGYTYYTVFEKESDRDKAYEVLKPYYSYYGKNEDLCYVDENDKTKYLLGLECVTSIDIIREIMLLSYVYWYINNKPETIDIIYDGIETSTYKLSKDGINEQYMNIWKKYTRFSPFLKINFDKIIEEIKNIKI